MFSRLLVLTAITVMGITPITAPAAAASAPYSSLRLILTEGVTEPTSRSTTLSCHPAPAGTHPHAREACAALVSADGDFTALTTQEGLCTLHYAPVTVAAEGRWLEREVDYSRQFANACVAAQATQGVFAF